MLPAGYVDIVDVGDPMPACRDAVVPVEEVFWRGEHVVLDGQAVPGRNVREVGADIREGMRLLPAGHRLGPADLAACATTGHAALRVARRPRLVIVPTGDEVRPLGERLTHGEITDSSSVMLAARAAELGAQVSVTVVQPDDSAAVAETLRGAAASADLVVVLAGSSAGRDDHTATAVGSCGSVVVHGVGLRPGQSTLLGVLGPTRHGVPLLGLPGCPVATAVAFEVFGAPILAALEGTVPVPARREPATLRSRIRSPRGAEEWVRVALVSHDDDLSEAHPRPGRAGVQDSLVDSDGLVCVGPGVTSVEAGEVVIVHLLPDVLPEP